MDEIKLNNSLDLIFFMETKLINNLSTQKLDYLGKKEIFFDRELSWLSFNERVLKTGFDNTCLLYTSDAADD